MKKILIIGTVAYDEIETTTGSSGKILGGAATYIGLGASLLNSKSSIISIVGGDFEHKNLKLLKLKGINTDSIEIVPKGKTFYWKGKYHKDWNKRDTLNTQLNVLADFNPAVSEENKKAEIIVLGNLHPEIQNTVLDQVNVSEKCIILDTMNFWMDNALAELMKVIKRVDIIIINDEEALQLSKKDTLFAAANKILSFGPKQIVIKKGEHGAMLFDESRFFTVPAFPVKKVIDPTGAGDTFAGGFAGYLSHLDKINFEAMKLAVVHGTVMASFCVEGFGTSVMESLEKETTNNRLKEFKNFTRY
ncbi:MAG: sugar kinase [Flavobacteriales bacterium]|jgi:sugar/nucleoside kinase (ribokinase family)|nr:MAG: sugar kinase [Flavobacteriales bacterium]